MLVTFSGLDGAGKSTLIASLREELRRRALPVTVLHMNEDVGLYAGLRRVRGWMRGQSSSDNGFMAPPSLEPRPTGLRHRLRDAIIWNKAIRGLIYPVDLLVFACCRLYIEKIRRQTLLMDRYFYDTLVDLSAGLDRRWLRALHWLTPAPELAVFLDISAEESFGRKGEYSIPYLQRRLNAYRMVRPWVPSAVTLPAGDLRSLERELQALVFDRMPA